MGYQVRAWDQRIDVDIKKKNGWMNKTWRQETVTVKWYPHRLPHFQSPLPQQEKIYVNDVL